MMKAHPMTKLRRGAVTPWVVLSLLLIVGIVQLALIAAG